MGSTFLGLGLFHCHNCLCYVKNSGNFPDAQNQLVHSPEHLVTYLQLAYDPLPAGQSQLNFAAVM